MAKLVAFVCPGRLGDIVMCLPMAQEFLKSGYGVIWPILGTYIPHFELYFPQITWMELPNDFHQSIANSQATIEQYPVAATYHLSYTFAGSEHETAEWFASGLPLDKYRYLNSGFSPMLKYELDNFLKYSVAFDQRAIERLALPNEFVLIHDQSSSHSLNIKKFDTEFEQVKIDDSLFSSIFDWIPVLRAASKIICIESCISNMVEQLQIKPQHGRDLILKKDYYLKDDIGLPTYSSDWKIF